MSTHFDVTVHVDVEEMPMCPLCDHPIFRHELVAIASCMDVVALAHQDCCQNLVEDEEAEG